MRNIVKEIILNKRVINGVEADILKKYLYQSHLILRRLIGIFALILALGVPTVDYFINGKVGASLSGYYHTEFRNIFVGILCVVGVFLFSYRSYNKLERLITLTLGFLAVAIAFIPTSPTFPTDTEKIIGYIHAGCAIVFFILFALLARLIFVKIPFDVGDENTRKAIECRNIVYGVCNIILVLDGLMCLIYLLLGYNGILVFESIALTVFGIAWIVKGKMIRHLISEDEYNKLNY